MSIDKFRFVSPGVQVAEIDQSRRSRPAADPGPVIIGRFERGPTMRPTKVDSLNELEEIFGSIPFKIDTIKWSQKNKGKQPKGQGNWKFDFKVPVRSPMASYLDDGEYTFKGLFKKAVQGLVKHLKRSAGPKGNLKQAKVVLKP